MCGLIMMRGESPGQVRKAMDAMSHRGKDGQSGIRVVGGYTLGHVRLAIQDLSFWGTQPYDRPHGVMAFVGEIFTNPQGRSELQHISDLLDRGADFHREDGFWSIVDLRNDGTFSAYTDHLGIKPLYYWHERGVLCSELEPMFALYPRPALNERYLANCIKWGYDYSGGTPYVGISQVPPGSVLTEDGISRKYWDWSKVPVPSDLRTALKDSVRNRLIGDRPVALLLSGGLDSSIIFHLLGEMTEEVRCFSIANGEAEFLPPGVSELSVEEPTSNFYALEAMQCPMDLGSLIPQEILARAIKSQGYNVCMTGDGADELFGGYRRSGEYDSQSSDVFCELPYYHLPRLDRVMMRHTVELRAPFLSPRVVAFALTLPWSQRIHKGFLKSAFRGLVPDKIINRPKLPLKSSRVKEGGVQYRRQLVEEFKNAIKSV